MSFFTILLLVILYVNPGWDQSEETLDSFDDVRERQKSLKANGVKMERECDESTSGPASIVFFDPDGNTILVD